MDTEEKLQDLIKTFAGAHGDKRISQWMTSAKTDEVFEWRKWQIEIPFIEFPPYLEVKIIPPFNAAVVRFLIRPSSSPDSNYISVYLDCYDMLGFMGAPYWEAYPIKADTERFPMADTKALLQCINEEFKRRDLEGSWK